jgi:hypothetical protein
MEWGTGPPVRSHGKVLHSRAARLALWEGFSDAQAEERSGRPEGDEAGGEKRKPEAILPVEELQGM